MSLTQRLTANEEIEPWSREASPSSRDRKMSFNPVGTWTEATGEEPTIGAYEVPKWQRMGMQTSSEYSKWPEAHNLQFRSSSLLSTVCSPPVSCLDMPR